MAPKKRSAATVKSISPATAPSNSTSPAEPITVAPSFLPHYLPRAILQLGSLLIIFLKAPNFSTPLKGLSLSSSIAGLVQAPVPTLTLLSFGALVIQFFFGAFVRERRNAKDVVVKENDGRRKTGFMGAWSKIGQDAMRGQRPKWEDVKKRTDKLMSEEKEVAAKVEEKEEESLLYILQALLVTLAGAGVFHVLAILLGASFFQNQLSTFLLSTLLSILAIFPVALSIPFDDRYTWIRLFSSLEPSNNVEISLLFPALGSIIGCWAGAIPIPLDWDRPWQAWPTTCVVGTIGGHALGTVASLIACSWNAANGV